ncbi:hypothetical protein [Xanthocytophaga flava]|uniref:hypothetical protein n=1 Tax=Xanthocytophaga flava TaxID=3048013 RepID=UPI0028D77E94|nr:hypothetical protein [Xanthocytophaga flavus]
MKTIYTFLLYSIIIGCCIRYTVYDAFGAGRYDGTRPEIPGLQSMYELQHYRNTRLGTRNMYRPYLPEITIERIRIPSR